MVQHSTRAAIADPVGTAGDVIRRQNQSWIKLIKPETADEWDAIVSSLREVLAGAESAWREALYAERNAR